MNLQNKHKFVVMSAIKVPSKGAIKALITPCKGYYQSTHYAKAKNYLITL